MMREDYKRRAWSVLMAGALAAALASCSADSPVTEVIDLKSPGVRANGEIKPNVNCGWGSLWVPLEWGRVPDDTKELAIMLARFKETKENGERKAFVQFVDLVSKFKPTEHRLVANVLPEGISWSYFGTNCVPRHGQSLVLEVFALDEVRHRAIDRKLATRLTEEALEHPDPREEPRAPGSLTSDTAAIGRLIVTYGPPPRE